MFVIKAKKRNIADKIEALRNSGDIPAVFYGAGKDSVSISVPAIDFKKVWKDAGESSVINLSVDGENVDVLIHEVQTDPVKDHPIHIDFLKVDMNKKIEVSVPVSFVGISNAVKGGLGNLVKVLQEVKIEALPKDLPHSLEVDLSKLENVNDQIFVSDIVLPNGVSMITKAEEVVASVVPQVEEKEEVSTEPVDLSKIEVEKKGKKEEEGAPEGESKE